MGLFDSVSDRFVGLIRRRATQNSKDILNGIREEAKKWRPDGHAELSKKRRHYYEGRQVSYLRNVLQKRHPVRGVDMTPVVLNYVRLIADQDSDVFRGRPAFEIDGAEDARAEDFAALVREARLVRVLKEADRRRQVARTVFLRAMHSPVTDRRIVENFWPGDVDIVPHPGAPTSTEHALAIVARVSGAGGKDCFEVWSRPDPDVPRYEVTRIDEDGNESPILESGDMVTWPLEGHAFCAMHVADPQGTPYVDDDHDLLDMQDAINTDWSLLGEMIRFQAASALVYSGVDDGKMAVGPGLVTRVSTGESLNVLDFNAKLNEVRESIKTKTRALAVTRRQNPDAYAEEPGPPLSGVSRRIQNQPQEEAREERTDHAKETVEECLLPLLAQVSDEFLGTSIHSEDAVYMFRPDEDRDFEDPDIRQRRVLEQLAEKLITRARAAVELGLYEDEGAAEEALAEMSANARPAIPPAQSSRFGELVLNQLGGADE